MTEQRLCNFRRLIPTKPKSFLENVLDKNTQIFYSDNPDAAM